MYSDFRAYLFSIPTATQIEVVLGDGTALDPKSEPVASGWNSGSLDERGDIDENILAYITQNISNEDMRVRFIRLWIAIEKSIAKDDIRAGMVDPKKEKTILKIFVAPEFYFVPMMRRSPYLNPTPRVGYYSEAEFKELYDVTAHLLGNYSDYHEGRQLKDWIFLCGTCVFNQKVPGPRREPLLKNVMIAVGLGKAHKERRKIRKMVTAQIDGISNREDFNECRYRGVGLAELKRHYFQQFQLFVEICLEHFNGLYMTANTIWQLKNKSLRVRFQVISAAGVEVKWNNVSPDMHVIRNDGYRAVDLQSAMTMVADYSRDKFIRLRLFTEGMFVQRPWKDISVDDYYEVLGYTRGFDVLTQRGDTMTPVVLVY